MVRDTSRHVRELLHDGHPTACVGEPAFFVGAQLADPAGRLEGTGKYMRHVKLRPGTEIDLEALAALISRTTTSAPPRAVDRVRSLNALDRTT
jgi:hypothetical protein